MNKNSFPADQKVRWYDRKRIFGLPISFTRYMLVEKPGHWFKLFTSIGFLSEELQELNLYRVLDIQVNRSIFDKIFGVGTITIYCQDVTSDDVVVLRNVKNPYRVREIITEYVEAEKQQKNVSFSELSY